MYVFRKLTGYVIPYWKNAVLGILLNLLGTFFSLFSFTMAMPFLKILFDQKTAITEPVPFQLNADAIQHNFNYFVSRIITDKGPETALIIVSVMVVGLILLKTSFSYLGNFTIVPLINGVIRDIRNKLYVKITNLPVAYYSEERRGDILLKTTGDVQEMANTMLNPLRQVVKAPIQIIIYITALFVMSYKLTFFVLILIPLSGYAISVVGKNLKKASIKGQNKLGELLSMLEETIFGLRIIKAFNSEARVKRKFQKENQKYTRIMNRILRKRMLANPFSEFISVSVIVVIMWYGGSQVLSPETSMLSPEAFITYLIIFSQIIRPAKVISNYYYNFKKGLASFERIETVLNAEETIKEKPNAQSIKAFKDSVVYEDVSFWYNHDYVLNHVNLEIGKGQTVAIVGQSGAGKSTLISLLPRFYDVKEGDIRVDGISIKDLKVKDLRGLIGLVTQESILFNDTVYNNIAFGRDDAAYEQVEEAARVANAHTFIMELENGYETNIGDQGNKLSGGQKQRISIARAIMKNPPILILDEATSSLDTESEKLVQDALYRLMHNRTSIIIAHRLSTVREADKIVVLHQGTVRETGSHNELIQQQGIYKKLHEMQMFE
ncbi:MAG: ABC transporter ATP-binding protein [Bacteroidales bacterium]|nr:ABC transporter ATP-binding protein [Bacteroidales bacterium]